jgi:protein-disulfide isomerase
MTIFPGRARRERRPTIGSLARRRVLASGIAAVAALATTLTLRVPNLHATDAVDRAQNQAPTPQLTDQQKAEFIKSYEALPKVNVPLDAGTAKVLVVKFNDYQCPPCRNSYYDYKPVFAKYAKSGQVKFVLKHFPLERECNAAVASDLHVASCEAAAAVVMAQMKGTSDKLEEWFFANQPTLTPEVVKQAAASVGGIKDFDAQYPRMLTLVRTDAGLGALLGAKSTPTFLINGRLIAGAMPAFMFDMAIEHELKR